MQSYLWGDSRGSSLTANSDSNPMSDVITVLERESTGRNKMTWKHWKAGCSKVLYWQYSSVKARKKLWFKKTTFCSLRLAHTSSGWIDHRIWRGCQKILALYNQLSLQWCQVHQESFLLSSGIPSGFSYRQKTCSCNHLFLSSNDVLLILKWTSQYSTASVCLLWVVWSLP